MLASTGAARERATELPTMIHVLHRQVALRGNAPALHRRRGEAWETISWRTYGALVQRAARGLIAHGVQPGDRVAILGGNRPEWVIGYLGAMAAGAVPVGLYPTASAEQCGWVLAHAEASVLLVDDGPQLEKIRSVWNQLPALRLAVRLEPRGPASDRTTTFDELLRQGDDVPVGRYHERLGRLQPTDLATLVYTSGTTGRPRGVMLSHRNLCWTAARLCTTFGTTDEERALSYLPLGHVAEQLATIHLSLTAGARVSFAESIDAMRAHLPDVRPSVFLGVPRLWEKMQQAIESRVATAPAHRRAIFAAARRVGEAFHRSASPDPALRLAHACFERLVYRRVREQVGLDRCRLAISSTAPLRRETAAFFASLGLPLYQIYGQSEATGPTTCEQPGAARAGSVGKPLPGVEVRIADDGEILVRGPNVFLGYYRDPAASAEVLEPGGWLRSGDVGAFDSDGYLHVTDRKKELIVTSGGKKTGPSFLEGLLETISPVAQAVVVGDGRPYLAALLTLEPVAAGVWAAERGIPFTSVAALAADPRLRGYLATAIAERINPRLSQFETIKRISVLPVTFSSGIDGELTPTLKLRRRAVVERYAEAVEALYAEPPPEGVIPCAPR